MGSGSYIVYYRVSTKRQGTSGLGLDAQRDAVLNYIQRTNSRVVEEYTEIESGKCSDRVQLNAAIKRVQVLGCKLLIAKLDRLSRDLNFITELSKSGVQFVCADMPEANKLTINLLACIAENERDLISQRTKAALCQAKKRGVRLGSANPKVYRALREKFYGRPLKDTHSVKVEAKKFADKMRVVIEPLFRKTNMGVSEIAEHLNDCGVPSRNNCKWSPSTVYRLVSRWNVEDFLKDFKGIEKFN